MVFPRVRFHTRIFLLSVILAILFPVFVHAQSSGGINDPNTYTLVWQIEDETVEMTTELEHGGTYQVPFGVERYLSIDAPRTIGGAEGELYYLPPDGPREFLTDIRAFFETPWTWEQEGTYELDVYEVELIVNSHVSLLDRILDAFLPVSFAASPGSVYLTTMQFEVHPEGPLPTPEPTCTFIADPTSITEGDSATLTWTSEHADTATIDNGIGAVATSGSMSISPETTTTYTATVAGEGGEVTCETTVDVTPAPELTLGEKAAALAKAVVDQVDAYELGAKGWDYDLNEYTTPERILSGYKLNQTATVVGLDCSGLITWAFNRSYDPHTISWDGNFVKYVNADGLYQDYQSDPVSESELQPGDALFFDYDNDPQMDHVAMYVGESGGYDIVNAGTELTGIRSGLTSIYKTLDGFVGFRRIHESDIAMKVQSGSPVDLVITDPDGNTLSYDDVIPSDEEFIREIPGELYYSEQKKGHDGNPVDVVYSPVLKEGMYNIQVVPNPDAAPDDTYSLTFNTLAEDVFIAEDALISTIPEGGFEVYVTDEDDIEVTEVTPESLFAQLKKVVEEARIRPRFLKFRILANAAVAEHFYERDRNVLTVIILKNLKGIIERRTDRGISNEDADAMLELINELITILHP